MTCVYICSNVNSLNKKFRHYIKSNYYIFIKIINHNEYNYNQCNLFFINKTSTFYYLLNFEN